MASFDDLRVLDVRVGTVVAAQALSGARRPAFGLSVDFGELGRLPAAVEALGREEPEALVGLQVVAVVNLPPRVQAGFESRVLVLAFSDGRGESVLLLPERPLADGSRLPWPEEP